MTTKFLVVLYEHDGGDGDVTESEVYEALRDWGLPIQNVTEITEEG